MTIQACTTGIASSLHNWYSFKQSDKFSSCYMKSHIMETLKVNHLNGMYKHRNLTYWMKQDLEAETFSLSDLQPQINVNAPSGIFKGEGTAGRTWALPNLCQSLPTELLAL